MVVVLCLTHLLANHTQEQIATAVAAHDSREANPDRVRRQTLHDEQFGTLVEAVNSYEAQIRVLGEMCQPLYRAITQPGPGYYRYFNCQFVISEPIAHLQVSPQNNVRESPSQHSSQQQRQ